ncbi:EpsG family protein [Epilithonimonas vandammei]|uniref:EpsG family protein n=1 Tax=Epilithonimonas vandammei TaxID=2487072 RepID=UPI00289636B3|nr:EpsG family protein [Epilithonimonas vandammei]
MLPYLIVFFLSILFTYLAQESDKHNKKLFFFVFSAFAILLPSLLAGFRDSGVGTDTEIYVDNVWRTIKRINSFDDFYRIYKQEKFDDIEFGYLLLNFIGSRFGESVNIIYFISSFIITLLIYLTAYDNRFRASMAIVMFIYLFGYFNLSLNIVRQSLAMAVGIYCFKYVEKRSWIKIIISLLIIRTFHNTGIFYVLFWGTYFISNKKYTVKPVILLGTLAVVYFIFIYFDFIILYAVTTGLLPKKFMYYLSGETLDYFWHFATQFLLFVSMAFMLLTYIKKEEFNEYVSYTYLKLLGSILILTSFLSEWSFRISYYFLWVIDIVFLPRILYTYRKDSRVLYIVVVVAILSLVLATWIKFIVIDNENETIPYRSSILEL